MHAKYKDMPVSFTLEKRTNIHNECPIRISWSFVGERYQTTLGAYIKKEDWDEERRIVKANVKNHNGQSADEINFLIRRVSTVVKGIEQDCVGSEFIVGKDMMKQAISDARAMDIARPEDILERCLQGLKSLPEIKTRYYKDLAGRYYKFLCEARNFYISVDKFYILQELFGRGERVAVPTDKFKPQKERGSMYPITSFTEVSKEEVFGR